MVVPSQKCDNQMTIVSVDPGNQMKCTSMGMLDSMIKNLLNFQLLVHKWDSDEILKIVPIGK